MTANFRSYPALLFDLDGTLVDTDHVHLAAFQEILRPYGVDLDRARYTAEIMGASNDAIGRAFLPQLSEAERARTLDAKEALYRAKVGAVRPVAGVIELLDYCDAQGIARAVVTNAPRANAEMIVGALGLGERLGRIICGSELAAGKPHPLPYLTGLEVTGARAENSLAFEDSISGIRAAVAAGLPVVGMTTGHPAERLIAEGAVFAAKDFFDARIYELIERRMAA